MTEQPQRLKDVTVTVNQAGILAYEHPMDIWEYRRLSDEEKVALYATIRGQIVRAATEQYPGHLYAFTEPQVEKPEGEFTIAEDKVIGKAVVIRCHAFVWAPRMVPKAPAPSPEDVRIFVTELEEANRKDCDGGYIDKWYDCDLIEWLLHLIRQDTTDN